VDLTEENPISILESICPNGACVWFLQFMQANAEIVGFNWPLFHFILNILVSLAVISIFDCVL
jgi:hypothetical protein